MNIDDVTHVIQLAIAPVFLLTAVGHIIGVLTNRLARIVDRTRVLEERASPSDPNELKLSTNELFILGRRLRLIYLAVMCEVLCALCVGLVIIVAFVDAFASANMAKPIALLFVLAMASFISGLIIFLREIFLAVTTIWANIR